MLRIDNNKKGFSLIEVMIALVIFVSCLLLIFTLFPMAVRSLSQGKHIFLATTVAQKEMEYIKTLPFNQVAMSNTDLQNRTTTVNLTVNGVNSSIPFTSYTTISEDPADANLRNVRVTVKYPYGSAVEQMEYKKSVSVETIIANTD
ncbi:MAG: prepilin-type N-terminal cleavage/methylation domain-containing protein [Vulcanimicrobiota bacterium]